MRTTFTDVMSEHMDCSDTSTRKAIISVTEAIDKNQMILSLSAKLYTMIAAEITEIDYGEIPKSKGDITKIPNYMELKECIDTLHQLLEAYKQPTDPVDEVAEAIDHLREDCKMWEKGFNIKSDLPIALYNTIALSIISSISFLISGSIEFIKETGEEAYQIKLDKVGYHKSKDNLLFKNLKRFNKACRNKELQKSIEAIYKAEKAVAESGIVNEEAVTIIAGIITTAAMISMISLLLPILQELVAFLYGARQNLSDYLSIQSDIVRLNAENVKLDVTKTSAERDKIYKKQVKIADSFKKISNKLAIKLKSSQVQAEKIVKDQNSKKYKIEDISKTAPDTENTTPSGIF